jgi:ABC-type phosphate transport system ATPase subunit
MNQKVSQFRSEVNAELKDINTKISNHINKVEQMIGDLGSGKASLHLGNLYHHW